MDNQHFMQCKNIVKQRKVEYEEKYSDASKERLAKIVEKKLLTTGIGALAEFEKEFGHLWGIDLKDAELTDRHKRWREIWEDTRNRILNKTNDQIRGVANEMKQYSVKWNRYQIQLGGKND